MTNKMRAWALSGVVHVALVFGACIGVAVGQGQLPIGENRSLPKATPVVAKSSIAPVALESMTPAAKQPDVIELKPGQLKAFESGDAVSWLLVSASEDATEDGLAYEEAAGGTVVFAYDVDRGRWGKFKVPENQPVILLGCNPEARGKYLLVKQEVDGKKVKVVARTYITIAAAKKDEKKEEVAPTPKPKPDNKPPVVTGRKLSTIVIDETEDKVAARYAFFESKEVRDYYKAKGHSDPVIVDKDVKDSRTGETPEKLVDYIERAKGKKLPQVYLVDSVSGDVVLEGELRSTMTPKEFLELVQKAGG